MLPRVERSSLSCRLAAAHCRAAAAAQTQPKKLSTVPAYGKRGKRGEEGRSSPLLGITELAAIPSSWQHGGRGMVL